MKQYTIALLILLAIAIPGVTAASSLTDQQLIVPIVNGTTAVYSNGYACYTYNNTATYYVEQNNATDIQTKLNLCPSTGCLVIVPPGTYTTQVPITVSTPGTHLQGSGYNTLITGGTNFNLTVIILTANNGEVSNLRISGNAAANNPGRGIWPTESSGPTTGHGIMISGAENANIHDLWINDTVRSSVVLANFYDKAKVTNVFASNSITDHLLYVSEGQGAIITSFHGSGYFARQSAFKIGSGTAGLTANYTSVQGITYQKYALNPNGYNASDDTVLYVIVNTAGGTVISNANFLLPYDQSYLGGVILAGDAVLSNVYVEGNVSGRTGVYLSSTNSVVSNAVLKIFGGTNARGFRILSNENNYDSVAINNFMVQSPNSTLYGKAQYGVIADLITTNSSLLLSNGYIDTTTGIRLNPNGFLNYQEINVYADKSTTPRQFSNNYTYLTQLVSGMNITNNTIKNANIIDSTTYTGTNTQLEGSLTLNGTANGNSRSLIFTGLSNETTGIDFNSKRGQILFNSTTGTLQLYAGAGRGVDIITNAVNRSFQLSSLGALTLVNLSGTGNDYVCVTSAGLLYRSDAVCA